MGRKAFVSRAAAAARAAAAESDGSDGEKEKIVATEPKEQAEEASPSIANAPSAAPAAAAPAAPPAASASRANNEDEDEDDEAPSAGGGKETRGQMVQRHKRELKAQKEASKRLGKKKKDEAAAAEAALAAKHEAELKSLEEDGGSGSASAAADGAADGAADSLSRFKLSGGDDREKEKELPNLRKGSKAARRRAERLAADAEREAERDRERAAAAGTGAGSLEARELEKTALAPLGLAVFDVPADGHCLYAALVHQLGQAKERREKEEGGGGDDGGAGAGGDDANAAAAPESFAFTVQSLRALAARHIRDHAADFEPFIGDDEIEEEGEGGDQGEEDGAGASDHLSRIERYCRRLEGTAAWGGQPELQALASALPATIRVLSAGMEPVVVEGEGKEGKGKGPELTICYLRHAFGLGEHYNSTVPAKEEEEEEREGGEEEGAAGGGGEKSGGGGSEEE